MVKKEKEKKRIKKRGSFLLQASTHSLNAAAAFHFVLQYATMVDATKWKIHLCWNIGVHYSLHCRIDTGPYTSQSEKALAWEIALPIKTEQQKEETKVECFL